MREIKFRAWDNKNKNWLLGYEYENLGGFSLWGEVVLMGEWAGVVNAFMFKREGLELEDLKVMQYTGLHDKNGKEIYEGDIIKRTDDSIREIRWSGRSMEMYSPTIPNRYWNSDASDFEMSEVIGNIYENPELLKRVL